MLECCFERRPLAPAVPGGGGGGDAVDQADALHQLQRAAVEGAQDRRVEQNDGSEQLGPAQRREEIEIPAERMADAEHWPRSSADDRGDQLFHQQRPAIAHRKARVVTAGGQVADIEVGGQAGEQLAVASAREAVGVGEVQWDARRAQRRPPRPPISRHVTSCERGDAMAAAPNASVRVPRSTVCLLHARSQEAESYRRRFAH